jgi:multidrug efflux pump subunit AcrA (membrane-fusion protein)
VEVQLEGEARPRVGRISRISPELDQQTRSLTFEADLPNPDNRLRAGLFAIADVVVNPESPVLAVPRSSITEFAGVERVWKLVDGEVSEVAVRTGQLQGTLVEILDGIKSGDEIIVQAGTARPGKVEIVKRVTLDPPPKLQAIRTDSENAAPVGGDVEEADASPVRSE